MLEKEIIAKKIVSIEDIPQIFDVLTEEQRLYLIANHKVLHFKKNEIIYHEGEKPTGLICLGTGKVKVFSEGIGGRDQIVRMATPPNFIGYRAFFAEENHIATAVAIESCTLFLIEREAIMNLLLQNNELCMNVIRSFASELGEARFRTVSLTQKHIRGRLAESLLFLRQTYGYDEDGCTLSIYLSREDLANFSNMTTSNAIRTLSAFAQERLIAIDGRIIKLLDESKLERISRLG